MDGTLVVDHSTQLEACVLCRRNIASNTEAVVDIETVSLCGDCKFLLLEDLGTPTPDSRRRRQSRRRRTRYRRSESIENLFSQQFSNVINLARLYSTIPLDEDQLVDGDVAMRSFRRNSSRTTPSSSRRWQRVLSDAESDGYDNLDSFYGESESNLSISRYRVFHSDSDAFSFSTYGGDSDASVDGHSFWESDMFIQHDEVSSLDSDTDIDPMQANLNQWNSDGLEGEEEDGEWEEADAEEDTDITMEARAQLQNLYMSSPNGSVGHVQRHQHFHSPEYGSRVLQRIREGRETLIANILSNMEESEMLPYLGNPGDYLDARGTEQLLEHLAETDNGSRRGAPPAAMSFVSNLPRVIVKEDCEKHDDIACAICKDVLPVGTEVNQLPCLHLYHPWCILPWLATRNSCPLCRFELPTDDKDYEWQKEHNQGSTEFFGQLRDVNEDSDSDISVRVEAHEVSQGRVDPPRELLDMADHSNGSSREGGGRRWFFLAAAPIVSLVGIVLVLWLGNPLTERIRQPGHCIFPQQGPSIQLNQRESRTRRWWSIF